jgi:ABC-type lipoprotein release transport system permease subunit
MGVVTAVVAAPVLAGQLSGLSPYDPVAYLAAALVLAVIALLASLLPAHRATRVEPVETLRVE